LRLLGLLGLFVFLGDVRCRTGRTFIIGIITFFFIINYRLIKVSSLKSRV
jgi:hypothetical protein